MAHAFSNVLSLVGFGLVGLGVLGCSGVDMEAEELSIEPTPHVLTSSDGAGSSNHMGSGALDPDNTSDLVHSASNNLATFDVITAKYRITNDSWNSDLLSTAEGRDLLKYAVKCALPAGQKVWYQRWVYPSGWTDYYFEGAGLLTTTTGWRDTGLGTYAIQDLMACVAAHTNPDGQYVDINLVGKNVTNVSGFDASSYTFEEAYWVAKVGYSYGVPFVTLTAYPLHAPVSAGLCMETVEGDMSRSCDIDGNNCHVQVGDVETGCYTFAPPLGTGVYCKNSANTWSPAIKTRLKDAGKQLLYSQGCMSSTLPLLQTEPQNPTIEQ